MNLINVKNDHQMKKTGILLLISFLGPLLFCSDTGTNLLSNGGFEKTLGSSNWYKRGMFFKGKGTYAISKENPRTGKNCLKITGMTEDSAFQLMSQKIPVKPGSIFSFSFSSRCSYPEMMKKNVCARINFYDDTKKLGPYYIFIRKEADSPDKWLNFEELALNRQNVSEYFGSDSKFKQGFNELKNKITPPNNRKNILGIFQIPPKTKYIRVYLMTKGAGITFFDDISLKPLNISIPLQKTQVKKPKNREDKTLIEKSTKNSSGVLDQLDKIEMERLLFEKGKDISTPKKQAGWTYEIKNPVIPKDIAYGKRSNYPEKATSLVIKNGIFYRKENPAYVLNFETSRIFNYWFWQTVNIDMTHIGDFYTSCAIRVNVDKKNKKLTVCTKDYPMASYIPPLSLSSGVIPYLQPAEVTIPQSYRKKLRRNPSNEKWSGEIALYRYFPELFVTNGHFISYRPGNADAERIRENAWRIYMNRASRFPVFAYELFNELYFMDYTSENIGLFNKGLKNKFSSLKSLNRAMNTEFKSWNAVTPPIMKLGGSKAITNLLEPQNYKANLWAEWIKVTEKKTGDFLIKFRNFVKKLDKKAYITVQPRPSADFDGELVGSDLHQIVNDFDFYAHEYSTCFLRTLSGGNVDENILRRMVHSRLRLESTRLACELAKKPILNVEGKVFGGIVITGEEKEKCKILSLNGKWNFMPDPKNKGEKSGYTKTSYNDSHWDTISVPGLWSEQGKKNSKYAWYRKKIKINGNYKGKVWLCGYKLSDKVKIFINGFLVHSTIKWNEKFNVDISPYIKRGSDNLIAINFYVAGIGGVREYLILSKKSFKAKATQPEQLRAGLWTNIIHGTDGDALSYNGPRGRYNSFVNPDNTAPETIANLPYIKAEINALAPIIMPKPRFPVQIGVLFSMDTKREILNKNARILGKRFYGHAFSDYLGPAWWTGLGTETVTDELLRQGAWTRYKILIVPLAWRVHPDTLTAIEKFVKKGGTLVVGTGSLVKDDLTGLSIDSIPFMKVRFGQPQKDNNIQISSSWVKFSSNDKVRKFELTNNYGYELIPLKGAEILAKGKDDKALITRNNFGKGQVYVLGIHPNISLFQKVLNRIIKDSTIKPQLEIEHIEGPAAKYVERQVLGRDGRYVIYMQDYGSSKKMLKIKPVGFKLPNGKYLVRDTQHFKTLKSPSGNKLWEATEIRNGISVTMDKQNPVCLLIENSKLKPVISYNQKLAEQRSKFLLHNFRPSPVKKRIAFIPSVSSFTDIDDFPTARLILEELGFQVDGGTKKGVSKKLEAFGNRMYSLQKVDILLLMGTRYMTNDEAKIIAEYVENGGSVLVAGTPVWGNLWHNNQHISKLLKLWGMKIENTTLLETGQNDILSRITPRYKVTKKHSLLDGVKSLCLYAPVPLRFSKDNSILKDILLNSSAKAEKIRPAGTLAGEKPLIAAFKVKKGRVLVVGSTGMFIPEFLKKADNARFLVNAAQWLTNAPKAKIDMTKMTKLLNIPGRKEFISKK